MIVISHPWEFVPKGSSHLNYHTNSTSNGNTNNATTNNGNITTSKNNIDNKISNTGVLNDSTQQQPLQQQQTFQKSHLNRILSNQNNATLSNQRKNIQLIVHPEDNNTSLNEFSFAYLNKSPLLNNINFEPTNEKWHLKQINEFCENEIFIRDNKVILSAGYDNDSKIIKKSFTFDSPIFDCNWFNFKTDSNDIGILKDSLCIFETQKLHVYLPNGSDFHIQLPFKIKNCWRLKDGILFERQIEYKPSNSILQRQNTSSNQILFTLSNPLDELKPVLCKQANEDFSKGTFLRENSKQVIIDIIENLNLVLVFSLINNVHLIYRINEYIMEDAQVFDNLLNDSCAQQKQKESIKTDSVRKKNLTLNPSSANLKTPLSRADSGTCLSMSINQSRRRLSVSPIISTYSFYNKLNINSPTINNQSFTTSTTATTTTTTTSSGTVGQTNMSTVTQTATAAGTSTNLVSAHQHYFQRNFSPMAAVSRSPSCSSSPAAISSIRRAAISNNQLANATQTAATITNSTLTIQKTNTLSAPNNNLSFMTPSIELNNYPYNQYKTPMNNYNTPSYRRNFTPQLNNSTILNCENPNELSMYEQMNPEYCFELIWTEPAMAGGDSTFNESASKFFYIIDLYHQNYVCYLMPVKAQLRCVKIDYNYEMDTAQPVGAISYIPAKDAIFVESRNLMVIIDNQSSLFVYSGLTKLCKLQLHNIIWNPNSYPIMQSNYMNNNFSLNRFGKDFFQSPIVTPIKSKLFGGKSSQTNDINMGGSDQTPNMDDSLTNQNHNQLFKTPKQDNGSLISKALINSTVAAKTTTVNSILQQHEYKSILDATGSRFSIRLNDNRLVRVNLTESSTCKVVNLCLEAFKYSLNKEIYYEIVQQWYIHRYTISGETIKDQLNIFLYLILNLCGCFDMAKLEQELPILNANSLTKLNNITKTRNIEHQNSSEMSDNSFNISLECTSKSIKKGTEQQQPPATAAANIDAKRAKCQLESGNDDDWEFLMNDDFIHKMVDNEKNLTEFSNLNLTTFKNNNNSDANNIGSILTPKNNDQKNPTATPVNENIKGGNVFSRLKRPIGSTSSTNNSVPSMFSTNYTSNSGGILFPYLKHILYTMHLIYEECKLHKSLDIYRQSLIQILYLLANELNLTLYMNYYEQENTFLLKLKSKKIFSQSKSSSNSNVAQQSSSSSSSIPIGSKPNSSSSLNYLINQEPPILHKFLMKLIENPLSQTQSSIINPFPIIGTVTKRIIRTIKIYALIALCTKPELKNFSFYDYVNQLFFKINFSGFQPQQQQSQSSSTIPTSSGSNNFTTPITTNSSSSLTPQIPSSNNLQDLFLNENNQTEFQTYQNYTLKFNYKPGQQNIYENIFSLCLEMGLSTINEIYDYPYYILFPILEAINWSRENPCFSWPSYAFDLIGRNDLSILKSNSNSITIESSQNNMGGAGSINNLCDFDSDNIIESNKINNAQMIRNNQSINFLNFGYRRPIGALQTNRNDNQEDNLTLSVSQSVKREDEDGMQHINQLETLKCRFNEDLRINEVRLCLQNSRPIMIKLTQGPDVSDHDFVEEEEKFLACICVRTMALPVGRGIFTLHTINPIPTEPVIIPEMNLKGKSVTKKTTIDLTRVEIPSNMTYWPLFHNGVAAGLTICAQAKDLSNAWIKSHLAKNFELTNEQAGFLYGLGLTGHLANFSMLNVHDALTRRHDLTNIAILLGLAASKIGSLDLSVTRLISMHIKALMPPVEIELEIPYNIQIAALLSLGLVYVKSANKHISYVLLKEIGRLPGNEMDKDLHSLDREAYSLTAGLALGLILLEKGKKSSTIMDSTFTDELYHYMVGGHKEKYFDSVSNGISCGTNGGTTCGVNSQIGNSNTNPSNPDHVGSYNAGNFRNNTNSSYIREGESINTNVTCPGATLALSLIYFNSCDKLISEWFAPPDSAFLLDSIRPDFLLLRTVARNLIMWKYILPSQDWILNQLSNLLKTVIKNDKVLMQKFPDLNLNETIKNVQKQKKLSNKSKGKKSSCELKISKISKSSVHNKKSLSASSKSSSKNVINLDNFSSEDNLDDEDNDNESINSSSDNLELVEEINEDGDDYVNILQVNKDGTNMGKSTNSKKSKTKHLLSDLIQFDDVEDDFFHDNNEVFFDLPNNKAGSKKTISQKEKVILQTIEEDEDIGDDDDLEEEYEDLAVNLDCRSEFSTASSTASSSSHSNNMIDDDTKIEAFRHIIAGACMSMGLKFAGSFNNEAYQTLLYWAKYFTDLNDARLSTENCLCVIVLSLSMVVAGSGDLEVLRICRYLRSRVGPNFTHVTYGSQMAINMALAINFMGGGKYTLKTDSLSVALMLCAFYPHFPVDSNDNRFHLQAFRHLYVLASEPRLLLSKDVDTNEFCYVPIEVTLKENEHHDSYKYKQMAPCLLPELNRIQKLKILGPRYYPIVFKENLHFNDLKNILLSELLVKQKNGYFTYFEDPKDEKAFNIRNILNRVIVPHKITTELLEKITNEEHINSFANVLNKSNENELDSKTNRLLKLIYESVVQETIDFVGIILLIEKEATGEIKPAFIQQMKLVESFYRNLSFKSKNIITSEFLYMTMNTLETKIRSNLKLNRDLVKSYINDEYVEGIEDLINYCILNDITKPELEYFINSSDFMKLIKPSNVNLSIDNLLKLYQLFN